jgi:DNA mismatch repair protein MutL
MDIAHAMEGSGVRRGAGAWREELIIKAASRASVSSVGALTIKEIEQLVTDLAHARMPYTCPRGRPTMILTSYRELARKFGRD